VKWWRKAAEAGEFDAQWYMGQCYFYGRGVDRDVAQAKVWFRKSAAQGFTGILMLYSRVSRERVFGER
jgi:TPR repeat protein